MSENNRQLIFVYNADSGLFNTVTDIAHKVFSPQTYNCQLCALTHSWFSMRQPWSDFLNSLNVDMDFLHRDELAEKYGMTDLELPVVLLKQHDNIEVLLDSKIINACQELTELQDMIRDKLSAIQN